MIVNQSGFQTIVEGPTSVCRNKFLGDLNVLLPNYFKELTKINFSIRWSKHFVITK